MHPRRGVVMTSVLPFRNDMATDETADCRRESKFLEIRLTNRIVRSSTNTYAFMDHLFLVCEREKLADIVK